MIVNIKCKGCWERLPCYAHACKMEYCYKCKNDWVRAEEKDNSDVVDMLSNMFWFKA